MILKLGFWSVFLVPLVPLLLPLLALRGATSFRRESGQAQLLVRLLVPVAALLPGLLLLLAMRNLPDMELLTLGLGILFLALTLGNAVVVHRLCLAFLLFLPL